MIDPADLTKTLLVQQSIDKLATLAGRIIKCKKYQFDSVGEEP